MLISSHQHSWAWCHEHSWALISGHKNSWVCAHRQSWLTIPTLEHGAVAQWALKIIQEHSWHHGNILITTPECPQMLMSALEFSRLLISVHDCSSAWFQKHSKCEFSKWAPCNDLQISKFIFHQIIKSDILKLYVERVVNKNETYYRSEMNLFLSMWIYFYLSGSISIYLNLFLSIWI